MLDNANSMTAKVDRKLLLEKLQENLKEHQEIVAEANEGYIKAAKKAVQSVLVRLKLNKPVRLDFAIEPPRDYSRHYTTAIEMLQWEQRNQIEISREDFRRFVQNKWDWTGHFIGTNSAYSGKARELSDERNTL